MKTLIACFSVVLLMAGCGTEDNGVNPAPVLSINNLRIVYDPGSPCASGNQLTWEGTLPVGDSGNALTCSANGKWYSQVIVVPQQQDDFLIRIIDRSPIVDKIYIMLLEAKDPTDLFPVTATRDGYACFTLHPDSGWAPDAWIEDCK